MKKRILSLVLVLVMVATLLPVGAFAATGSGTCGDGLTWTLDSKGTLTISGTGTMPDYDPWNYNPAPWYYYSYNSSLKKAVIESGVKNIGNFAFYGCDNLASVEIAAGVESIGSCAFDECTELSDIAIPQSVKSIGKNAFNNTPWLREQGDLVVINGILLMYRGTDKVVAIPAGVKSIAEEAFMNNSSLTSVAIPDSVQTSATMRSAIAKTWRV